MNTFCFEIRLEETRVLSLEICWEGGKRTGKGPQTQLMKVTDRKESYLKIRFGEGVCASRTPKAWREVQNRIGQVVVSNKGNKNLLPILFIHGAGFCLTSASSFKVKLAVWNSGPRGNKRPYEKLYYPFNTLLKQNGCPGVSKKLKKLLCLSVERGMSKRMI